MNTDAFPHPVIGLDVGGTNITGGLVDEHNTIVARNKIDTEAHHGPEHVVDRIALCVEQLIHCSDFSHSDILGVGLAIPGAVNPQKQLVIEAVNLRWSNVKITKKLSPMIKLPITLDNDVNAGAWGEAQLGAGQGCQNQLAMFIGTGIGGGIILNGKLFHGAFGYAGEIGHITMDVNGAFGARTLEQLASRTAIVNRLVHLINANHPSELRDHAGKKWPRIRSKALSRAMKADDKLTLTVLKEAAHVIGCAAAGLTTAMNYEKIIIGGGLTEALDDRWIKWITKAYNTAVFPKTLTESTEIQASQLGDDAGLLGAALLARERISHK